MTIGAIALSLVMFGAPAQQANVHWWYEPSTQKVFPETRGGGMGDQGQVYCALGEYEDVQLCLRSAKNMPGLRVIVKPRAGYKALPARYFKFFEVDYVPTPKDPVHKLCPDPLAPLGPNHRVFNVKAGQTKTVWVQVHPSYEPAPGDYCMDVQVWDTKPPHDTGIAHHLIIHAPLYVHVWPFRMPTASHLRTGFGTWTSMMAPKFGVHLHSRQLRYLKQKVYYELLNHRICANQLPYDVFDQRAEQLEGKPNVNGFWMPMNLVDKPGTLGIKWERVRRRGVTRKAYILPWDEAATRGEYRHFEQRAETVREVAPGLAILGTFGGPPAWAPLKTPMDEMKSSVDLWCFLTPMLGKNRVQRELKAQQEEGKQGWVYVCCSPRQGHWANYLINMSALQNRVLPWQIYRAGLQGLLYWGVNYWEMTKDPWKDVATVKWISPDIYGDGSLLYPGTKVGVFGPVPSIRLECIRDSLEDYEYLVLAQRVLGKDKAMAEASRVTTGWTKFVEKPSVFDSVRRDLGEQLAKACE